MKYLGIYREIRESLNSNEFYLGYSNLDDHGKILILGKLQMEKDGAYCHGLIIKNTYNSTGVSYITKDLEILLGSDSVFKLTEKEKDDLIMELL